MADLILEIVEGDEAGRQVDLGGPVEIGRDPSGTLALDDDQVSRNHARVSGQGDLALVEDLGSTNGTYVNGQPIEGPRALRPGDRVRVGLTVIELRTAQDVQRKPSAVIPIPQVTQLSRGVLEPAPEEELAPPPAPGAAAPAPAAAE
ncbi:MAG: FHA domain-containing protein, partial [Thermoleophilaceae bacterium]